MNQEQNERAKRIEWNNVSSVVKVAVCNHFAGFIAHLHDEKQHVEVVRWQAYLAGVLVPFVVKFGIVTELDPVVHVPPDELGNDHRVGSQAARERNGRREAAPSEAKRIFNGIGGRRASQTIENNFSLVGSYSRHNQGKRRLSETHPKKQVPPMPAYNKNATVDSSQSGWHSALYVEKRLSRLKMRTCRPLRRAKRGAFLMKDERNERVKRIEWVSLVVDVAVILCL